MAALNTTLRPEQGSMPKSLIDSYAIWWSWSWLKGEFQEKSYRGRLDFVLHWPSDTHFVIIISIRKAKDFIRWIPRQRPMLSER